MGIERQVDKFITEKGSIYKYLSDGRTQRFKTITQEFSNPQDAIVFIPDYQTILKIAPKRIIDAFGPNELRYLSKILSYMQHGKKIRIVDKKGNRIFKNNEIQKLNDVWVSLGTKTQMDYMLLVEKNPQLGFTPFDTTLFIKNNQTYRDKHMGHKIIEIVYK